MQSNVTPVPAGASVNTINPSVQIQGAYQGSISSGTANNQILPLSLKDAIARGIKYNLGPIGAGNASVQARAQRVAALAQLLPDLMGYVHETVQQTNLQALGLRIQVPIPGFTFPTIVGPFNYFDARATLREEASFTSLRNLRAARESVRSAQFSERDSRDLVVLAVSGSYLQLIASAARIETARAQIESARSVYQQAYDRHESGLSARIDVNRSLVELQTQQQRLTSLTNDFEKQKITLARLIGLPMAQPVAFTDSVPFAEPPLVNVEESIARAMENRADVRAASAQVKAADNVRKAASAEYFPTLSLNADYGAIGIHPTQSHGTFSVSGGVNFPIYRFGRIRADIDQADAALSQRRAEYEDTRGRAEQDVRNAYLDLTAATQQVRVAQSNRALASETLEQARDRFRAGVADTVEVVQAQESVATAEQDLITSLFALNLARVSLARATGDTEQGVTRLLQGK